MDYFPKTEMLQLAPAPNSLIPTEDPYSVYADNFDLSLLPNEQELPLSSRSDFSTISSISSTTTSSSPSPPADHIPQVSLEYIPTTVYHDSTVTQIKIEKPWGTDSSQKQSSTTRQSSLLEKFKHHYKPYPTPQPSSPGQELYHPTVTAAASIYPPSPCPSTDAKSPFSTQHQQIKQELHILPPSPPESSCGAPSPRSFVDVKQEPDEVLIDINSLLEKSLNTITTDSKLPILSHLHQPQQHHQHTHQSHHPQSQDYQLLREYLEDTSFQRKHNLKPVALESLIGGLGVRSDIEPVISLALEHAKREAEETCTKLQISADPQGWNPSQVHAWLRSTVDQFKLPPINDLELKFPEDGATLSLLTEEEFVRRAPEAGGTIHAQLEIWKLACSATFPIDFNANPTTTATQTITATQSFAPDTWNSDRMQNFDIVGSEDEDEEIIPSGAVNGAVAMASATSSNGATTSTTGAKTTAARTCGSHIHLWQFLKELLVTPHVNGTAIRWIDRSKGVFKIEDSVRVAKLWGRRKNRPAMNYDKLSRSIRQYYKKGIMKKTERSQRLVYQFCHPYGL